MRKLGSDGRKGDTENENVGAADLLDQGVFFCVLAAVIALLADQKQNAAVLLWLCFEQIDRGTDGVEYGCPAVAWLHMRERIINLFARAGVVADQMRTRIERHQRDFALRVGEEHIEQRSHFCQLVKFENTRA